MYSTCEKKSYFHPLNLLPKRRKKKVLFCFVVVHKQEKDKKEWFERINTVNAVNYTLESDQNKETNNPNKAQTDFLFNFPPK